MKLRLRGNSIRLRLSKTEVEALSKNCILTETTLFAPGQSLVWTVESSVGEKSVRTEYGPKGIHFYIPQALARTWADSETVGMYTEGTPRIAVEKDFKCLEERKGEDDQDGYPNPLAAKS
ncbi:MAG: hypothetical protein JNM63_19070 [Spirochaetia bacterium]|nr:hypothetical protein [Spirochaetia bacterium]